jgi:glutaminyl-tRNA synthetase
MELKLPDPTQNTQVTRELLDIHLRETGNRVITRFPPEPNGHLHIGHAKAIFIDFGYAAANNGYCYLRFDDTNPLTEKEEYVRSIIADIEWLGYKPHKITYSSDYFDQLYDLAILLIKRDKAYICELSSKDLQQGRRDGVDSPYRNRSIIENLELFERMKRGEFDEGTKVLRMKINMQSDNPNMRDPVAYRIIKALHHRTGDKWCIYPSYDYTHCIVDSLENITHSLCSIEFQTRNESYRWLLDALSMYKPPQIEYSRLNLTHCLLSKRKLIRLIEEDVVDGWDDPRLPSIKGFRRRGYTPESIRSFAQRVGVGIGNANGFSQYEVLEECVRQHLDAVAPRVMVVTNPIKLIIDNWEDIEISYVEANDFPALKDKSTKHVVKFDKIIWIEKDDFRVTTDKNYYRLTPTQKMRLKYAGLIEYVTTVNDVIHVRFLGETGEKVKGTVNWVSGENPAKVIARFYDHLFPSDPTKDEGDCDWLSLVNRNSVEEKEIIIDDSVLTSRPYDKYQFERIGYFSVDPESTSDKLIFNHTVSLKESKLKN